MIKSAPKDSMWREKKKEEKLHFPRLRPPRPQPVTVLIPKKEKAEKENIPPEKKAQEPRE